MRSPSATIARKKTLLRAALVVVALGALLVSTASAQEEDVESEMAQAAASSRQPAWQAAFVDFCATIAPYMGVLCFLAPLPTILQVSRDKTVGSLPLLPYSSMVANGFVWVMYGILKDAPSVYMPNAAGVCLGAYYFAVFARHCGPMASNLPGTVGQHLKGTGAVVLFNLSLATSGAAGASEVIGKEGVFFCVVLFASPLAALRTVVATRSAASIPLPFTVATFVNCLAWSVMGWWRMRDFNIYFPNLLGLSCAVAQLALKAVFGNRSTNVIPK